jgi:hypothetical protein
MLESFLFKTTFRQDLVHMLFQILCGAIYFHFLIWIVPTCKQEGSPKATSFLSPIIHGLPPSPLHTPATP